MKTKNELTNAQRTKIWPNLLIKGLGIFIIGLFLSSSAWAALEGSGSGLVGWWTFNDGSGTSAQDSSGNGNTGTLTGSPLPSWTTGEINGALSFNGSNKVTTPLSSGTGPISQCAWIYPTSTNGTEENIVYAGGSQLFVAQGGSIYYYNDENDFQTSSGVVPVNTWSHVCATVDGSNNVILYLNGVSKATGNVGGIPFANAISIGSGFTGKIDDARVYDRALSGAEVASLYNEGLSGGPTTTYSLTLTNSGSGSVVSSPSGISCPSTCQANYTVGTIVELTATPPSGYVTTWSNCGTTTGGNTCTLVMSAATSVSSSYTAIPPAPVISAIMASSITSTSAVISWTTDQAGNSQINYGTTSDYGQQTTLADTNPMVTSHTVTLSNLLPSTIYHFQVDSQNSYGILGQSSDQNFTTLAPGPAAPLYVSAMGVSADQINVVWYLPSDNSGTVNNYTVYRDGVAIATVAAQTFGEPSTGQGLYEDQGLSPSSTHTYYVVAHDTAAFTSPNSVNVTATTQSGTQNLIPSQNLIDWTPGVSAGVPGGIPTLPSSGGTIIDVTQAPYNADKTGATDSAPAIQEAMNAAASGDVVYLPAGNYTISSPLSFWGYNPTSNVVFRGAGPANTIIQCNGSSCIGIGTNTLGEGSVTASITGGLSKGSTQLTLASTSGLVVGGLAKIIPSYNDPSFPVIAVSGPVPGSRTQLVRITAMTSTTLTIEPALFADYTAVPMTIEEVPDQGKAGVPSQGNFMGIEDLTFNGSASTTQGIMMEQIYGGWINNVVINNVQNYIVMLYDCLNCEIRHTTINGHGVVAPNHSGIILGSDDVGCLIEDNIINNGFPAIEVDSGSSGNVVGYNFITSSGSTIDIDTNHDPHNEFNLFEGNITTGYNEADGYYGSVSDDIFFRNWMIGGITIKRFTRDYSLIGNITSTPTLGEPNIGNSSITGFAEPSQGLFWQDWNPTIGPALLATVQSVSGTTVTLTVDNSPDAQRLYGYMTTSWCIGYSATLPACGFPLGLDWGQGRNPSEYSYSTELSINLSTNTLAVTLPSNAVNIPSVGTVLGLWPRAEGFQELDMDVALSTIFKENYDTSLGEIPSYEALPGTETLPNSLYRSSVPSWFGSIAWPPINPGNPPASGSTNYDMIPAGYRYDHPGQDTPGLSTSSNLAIGCVSGDSSPTIYDAELTAQASVGSITLSSAQQTAAEVDGTGKLDIYDAYLIAEYAVGSITKFPVQND